MMKSVKIAGFSLIELMVVVGIIGILSTIALPQYNKFSSKARQAEAKSQLGGIFMVEKALITGDVTAYASCLGGMGFGVDGNRRYAVGFTNEYQSTVAGFNCSTSTYTNGVHYYSSSTLYGRIGTNIPTSAFVTTSAFTAGAAGNIAGDTKNDQWTIDENQNLVNTNVGY